MSFYFFKFLLLLVSSFCFWGCLVKTLPVQNTLPILSSSRTFGVTSSIHQKSNNQNNDLNDLFLVTGARRNMPSRSRRTHGSRKGIQRTTTTSENHLAKHENALTFPDLKSKTSRHPWITSTNPSKNSIFNQRRLGRVKTSFTETSFTEQPYHDDHHYLDDDVLDNTNINQYQGHPSSSSSLVSDLNVTFLTTDNTTIMNNTNTTNVSELMSTIINNFEMPYEFTSNNGTLIIQVLRYLGGGGFGTAYKGKIVANLSLDLMNDEKRLDENELGMRQLSMKNELNDHEQGKSENLNIGSLIKNFLSSSKNLIVNSMTFQSDESQKEQQQVEEEEDPSKIVAIKVSKKVLEEDNRYAQRHGYPVGHEKRILKKLGEFKGETILQGRQVLLMSYHQGKNILQLLYSKKIRSNEQLNQYRLIALDALKKKLHEKGVVHHDINPHNILFEENEKTGEIEAHFIDFGMSVEMDSSDYTAVQKASFEEDIRNLNYVFHSLGDDFFGHDEGNSFAHVLSYLQWVDHESD